MLLICFKLLYVNMYVSAKEAALHRSSLTQKKLGLSMLEIVAEKWQKKWQCVKNIYSF